MDVSQTNYDAFVADFKENLPKAEFYAIDFEMTGIKTRENPYVTDLPYEKYLKLRHAGNTYRIIQMGICLFIRTGEKAYQARPYNIYLFPREYGFVSPQINIDSSAADFNTKHNMNWNKWFAEGITYMTLKQAKRKKQDLDKADKKFDEPIDIVTLTREDDLQKSKQFVETLEAWIENKDNKEPLVFKEQSSLFRKHIYDTLQLKYKQLVFETIIPSEKANEKEVHIFKFADESEKEQYYAKKAQEKKDQFESLIGFTSVFQLLLDCKKPMVGHNCYFDLLFLYSHFLEQLPYSFDEFKKNLTKSFPEIYDTKFIFENSKFKEKVIKSTSLDALTPLCRNEQDKDFFDVNITLEPEFNAYEFGNTENARYHEAGYDAFLTGYVYAKTFFALEKEDQLRVKNSVNALRSLYYLKLDGEDLLYKQSSMILIQQENKEKVISAQVLEKFEETHLHTAVRLITINQSGFQAAMLIYEPQNDQDKETFSTVIENLKQEGYTTIEYSDYCVTQKEKYDKGEKGDKGKE